MAFVAATGFETGTAWHPNWLDTGTSGTSGMTTGSGRDGVGVAFSQANNLGATQRFSFTAAHDTLYMHIGAKVSAINGLVLAWIMGDTGATTHIELIFDAAGHLYAKRGAGGTTLASSTQTVTGSAVWYSFEIKCIIADSGGEITVKVNGTQWLTFTGDTKNAGTATRPDTLKFSVNNDIIRYDDIVIYDASGSTLNTWTGEVCIVGLRANGNGANSVLVGSDGNSTNNYQQVDEFPFNTSDYNGSATATDLDTYDMTAVAKTGTVIGVQLNNFAAKSDAGARSFKHVMRASGGTMVKSSAVGLSTTYTDYVGPWWETDGNGSAWTTTNLDTHEFGFEVA